jgi:hypothetical protein
MRTRVRRKMPTVIRGVGWRRMDVGDALVVEEGAVGGAEVLDRPAVGAAGQPAVAARHGGVVERELALRGAADRDGRAENFLIIVEDGWSVRSMCNSIIAAKASSAALGGHSSQKR